MQNILYSFGGVVMSYRIIVDSCGELTDEMKKSGRVIEARSYDTKQMTIRLIRPAF